MADLLSPGVLTTITSEPMGSESGFGTIPLFFISTAQDKLVQGSDRIAVGTTKENSGKIRLITSQKDVLETYGSPIFQKSNGSVVQGDELNEYGLHALHSYMGIANRAYVIRADLDLNALKPSGNEPKGDVPNGTLWVDLANSQMEAYVSKIDNPKSFYDWELRPVTFVVAEKVEDVPLIGHNFNDIIVRINPKNGQMLVYVYRGILVQLVTTLSPINRIPTVGGVWIRQGYTQNGSQYFGTRFSVKRYMSSSNRWNEVKTFTGNSFYDVEAQTGQMSNAYLASIFDKDSYSFTLYINSGKSATKSGAAIPLGESDNKLANQDGYITIKFLNKTITVLAIKKGEVIKASNVIQNINMEPDFINNKFTCTGAGNVVITNTDGLSFEVTQGTEKVFSDSELKKLTTDGAINYSKINDAKIKYDFNMPKAQAKDGTLWFDFSNTDSLNVTLYVSDYFNNKWSLIEDDNKYVQLDEPAADRDFWIKPLSQGFDGYIFYRNLNGEWIKLDPNDQSTLNGIVYGDFKHNMPSAELYMNGMLAVDLASTEGVVKIMKNGEWHVASGVDTAGAALFGRAAQRKIVVEALSAAIVDNEDIRAESYQYNLITCPGYVETLNELIGLNTDIREKAFIVTDVPARLKPISNSIQRWATNADNAPRNGDIGRITAYSYAAQYMGWCLGTNTDGSEVVIPGSTVAMRTYAYSDSVSYVWFSPAGTQRGIVTNANSVGYINEEGDYQPVVYNQGQRNSMYVEKINPIAMRPSRGLLVFGDKTLSPVGDSDPLSRVNVARLVVYIRRQIEIMSEPFLFRLNVPSTRQDFAGVVTNFLAEIVQLDGLYDFAVQCDEGNNTRTRINRNELWLDVVLYPTKSINYIYVPIRVENQQEA